MTKNAEIAAIWDLNQITEEYKMESNMFDYDEIKKKEFFGIKKY